MKSAERSEVGLSYDVRIWKLEKYKGARRTTYTVRWVVEGRAHRRTFATVKLAEAFRAELLTETRRGVPFQIAGGLPISLQAPEPERSWLAHAQDYVRVKWPAASARHRRGIAEALTDVTVAIIPTRESRPAERALRQALYSHVFNASSHKQQVPDDLEPAVTWLQRNSPSLSRLEDAAVLRTALDRLALRQDGTPAAPSTVARKRATLHSVLEYAVELELFASNPVKRVRWKAPKGTDAVDRRVVVNPRQARALLNAVWRQDPALAGFFSCLYYAGLRPSEARNSGRRTALSPRLGGEPCYSPEATRPPAPPGPTQGSSAKSAA